MGDRGEAAGGDLHVSLGRAARLRFAIRLPRCPRRARRGAGHDLLVHLVVDQRGRDHQHAGGNGHDRVADGERPQQRAYTQRERGGGEEDEAEPQGGEPHRDRRVVGDATQQKEARDEGHDNGREGRHAV